MRNQIVILAGGKGKRMEAADMPKVLVMLKNKPIILYLLEEVEKVNQLAKPVIVVGYMADKVKAVLGEGYKYALQAQQLGTADAVHAAKPKVFAENILVLYGDMPFIKAGSIQRLMRLHQETGTNISMFTSTVESFEGDFESLNFFGRIIRNETGDIQKITEYKDATEQERLLKEVNPGIYMFKTEWLWQNIEKIGNSNAQKEFYLTDIIAVAIAQNQKIQSLPIDPAEVQGINSKLDLEQAKKVLG